MVSVKKQCLTYFLCDLAAILHVMPLRRNYDVLHITDEKLRPGGLHGGPSSRWDLHSFPAESLIPCP